MTMAQRTFRDAYGILQKHAETLRNQDEPNIDDLLTIVTESVDAYKVCKERIDAVEAALKAALDGAGVGASTQTVERATDAAATRAPSAGRAGRTAPRPPEPYASDEDDDKIPF